MSPRSFGLLRGRVVVVAGYGPGLGAALASRSAEEGARVVLASRTQHKLDDAVERLREAGHEALAVATDVESDEACRDLVDRTRSAFGRVDVLFANAFRMPPMDPLTQVDHRRISRAMDVNVMAPLRLASVFADSLAEAHGNIVMVNSGVLWQSQPEFAAYKLTKGAMLHMAQSLATELGPRGIRVNSLAPSYIYEDVNKAYFDWLAAERGVTHADVYAEKADLNDLKRLATAEQIADAAVLLASPLASTITGVCLDASCGEFHR
ncbi:SDR family oxidoreductase [Nocardioides sp. HDW12B]|nr:SDR family oxidoreductase [Nocardioides sp. HDW12B]